MSLSLVARTIRSTSVMEEGREDRKGEAAIGPPMLEKQSKQTFAMDNVSKYKGNACL